MEFCSKWMLSLIRCSSLLLSFCAPSRSEPHTLSLHDALPISRGPGSSRRQRSSERTLLRLVAGDDDRLGPQTEDRKSTRLNSSHVAISYAVFCLKKKTR